MNCFAQALPASLDLIPTARRPTTLSAETVRTVLARPVPPHHIVGSNAAASAQPTELASIIVVTFNNLVFTRMCIESVLGNTMDARYELIVVDNGSTDGSPEYLRSMASRRPHVHAIFNGHNRGFAAANNQGLKLARGAVLVLLNNDTIVPKRWLSRLVKHLGNPSVGMVSPVTNRSGNETEIEVPYATYGAFLEFAEDRHQNHRGERFDTSSLIMFCAAMRHDVWAEIGPLDERFEVGMFEDDDYAMRLRSAGYRVVCADDTFVHHFGQTTLGMLTAAGEYGRRFHTNRRLWEGKWARPWTPHCRRTKREYELLVERIRTAACSTIPVDAEVAVVSSGDDELLDIGGRRTWHLPCEADGTYAGYHPRDSGEAIAHLEALRGEGANYLIVPSTASWWLDHYADFRRHLERQYQLVAHDPETCAVFALSAQPAEGVTIPGEGHPCA